MKTNWDNLFKVRLGSSDDSFQKHEVVKLLLVMKIINKYKSNKNWIRVYTEFSINNGSNLRPDIYFENIKDKSVICYEIQKNYSKEWLEKKTKQYNNYAVPFFNSIDFIPINLNDCPEKISEINKWLDKYIF